MNHAVFYITKARRYFENTESVILLVARFAIAAVFWRSRPK